MDIAFSCEKCGQNIVVDGAGAGITVDCPRCGQPVYVPSSAAPAIQGAPVRIETASTRKAPTTSPITPVPSRPVGITATFNQGDVHPSIVASLRCLIIGAVLFFAGFIAPRQNFLMTVILPYIAMPFLVAALLCAVYGMCIGHMNQGLLLVAGLSLTIGLLFWISFRAVPSPTDIQRQIEQQMRQMMR